MKYKLKLFFVLILLIITPLVYQRFESNLGSTSISRGGNEFEVKFNIDGIYKEKDVQLITLGDNVKKYSIDKGGKDGENMVKIKLISKVKNNLIY